MNITPDILINAPAKIRVILTNLLTWLIGIQTVLAWLVANNTLDFLPWPEVSQYVLIALSWVTAATIFIRRVTPVDKQERGLLPVE